MIVDSNTQVAPDPGTYYSKRAYDRTRRGQEERALREMLKRSIQVYQSVQLNGRISLLHRLLGTKKQQITLLRD